MENHKTISEIAAEIVAKGNNPTSKGDNSFFGKKSGVAVLPVAGSSVPTIRPVDYKVDPNAIYDRLNDGSYIAKFDNYLGETGNEDRLAKLQTVPEQIAKGLGKNISKTFNYALDATLGTAYGVYKAVSDGEMSSLWDNDFSKTMDDWNKTLDNKLPNYYTDEEKSNGLLAAIPGFGATNFWFNDVAGGLAFVGGAILPEIALGAMTGGASLAGGLAKTAAKTGGKKLLGKVDDAIGFSKGKEVIRSYNRAIYGAKAGDLVSTAGFLVRSSNFEAGMEARHNFKESVDTYYKTFEEKNGRLPTLEESSKFMVNAKNVANGVYGANMAILSVSNAAMFGKTFDIDIMPNARAGVDNFFNKAIGLGTTKLDDGTRVMQEATKANKILGTTYTLLKKPAIEGLYEEGFQGVVGKTMQNYLEEQYDPKSNETASFFASLHDAFADQYGSKDGWKEMGIGMIIGFAGGKFSKQGFAGIGKNGYKAIRTAKEQEIDVSNEGIANLRQSVEDSATTTSGVSILRAMSKADSARKSRSKTGTEASAPSVDNLHTNLAFIQSQEGIKPKAEIRRDFETVVENMQLTAEQQEKLEESGISFENYKQGIIEEFSQTMDNYSFAKKAVEALRLDQNIKDSAGNIHNVKDAMIWNIMMGKNAALNAKKTGEEIEAAVGKTGVLDYLQFYNNLTEDKKEAVKKLTAQKKTSAALQKKAIALQNQLAGITTQKQKDGTVQKKYAKTAELYAANTVAMQAVNDEIETLEKALEADFATRDFELNTKSTETSFVTISEALDQVEALDSYIHSLETMGKNVEANTLKQLISEFKLHTDLHREFVNGYRRTTATNFFSSKEGATLLERLRGKKYEPSAEFLKDLKDNDEKTDNSLQLAGVRGYETVDEIISQTLVNNSQLSDREKFKLEAIIRLQLNMGATTDAIDSLSLLDDATNVSKTATPGPILQGDSVALRKALDFKADNLTSLEVINKTIAKITSEIDAIRNSVRNTEQEQNIEEQIKTLQEAALDTEEEKAANDSKIAALQEELESLKDGVRIITSAEYIRLNELTTIEQEVGLSRAQQDEIEELRTDIDEWLAVTGTVVEGVRLSDLIQQKVALENSKPIKLEKVSEVTDNEVISETEFVANMAKANYDLGQTHEAVTTKFDEENDAVILSGIREEDVPSLFATTNADGTTTPIDFEYSFDPENNNMIIPMGEDGENLARVNAEASNISVRPTNKDLVSTYSLVIVHRTNMAGEKQSSYLKSNYADDYTETQNTNAIYDLEEDTEDAAGSKLVFKVDSRDQYNKDLFYLYEQAVTKKEKELVKDVMKRKLRITVFDAKGNFIATLKGKKLNSVKSPSDIKFEQFRDSIVEDENFMETVMGATGLYEIASKPVTVKKVFLGHPNFNFEKNADGSVSIVYKQFNDMNTKNVVDIGFITNGEIKTRTGEKGIDTTFVKKAIKNKNAKTPFIVIEKGSKRIAYPVRLVRQDKKDNKELESIFNSSMDPTTKAIKLNGLLADRGLNVKEPGNFFYHVGNSHNLTTQFFEDTLQKLDGIEYFYSLEDWYNTNIPISEVLKQQALVNIDMSNPVHSPKVAMNFSNIYQDYQGNPFVTEEEVIEKEVKAVKGTTKTSKNAPKSSNTKTKYSKLPSEKDIADSAKDELDTKC